MITNYPFRYFSLFIIVVFVISSCKKDVLTPASSNKIEVATTASLNKITFVNERTGYIVGGIRYEQADLLMTQDGGATWKVFNITDADGKEVYGLARFNERTYAAGFDGKIFVKSAPEAEWRYVQSNWWEWFQDIQFVTANKGFVVAGINYRNGRIFQVDSLGNINKVDSFDFELTALQFADNLTGYSCGFGAVLKTTNGGDEWLQQNLKGDYFKAISCVDALNVWIVGYNGTIVHTADGGENWQKQRNGDNPTLKKYRLRAVHFKDIHTGYAAGDKGLVLKTTDGGEHWSEFSHFTDNDLHGLTFHPDGSMWVVGDNGSIFRIVE